MRGMSLFEEKDEFHNVDTAMEKEERQSACASEPPTVRAKTMV